MEADTFDIVGAYEKALQDDQVGRVIDWKRRKFARIKSGSRMMRG